MNIRDGQSDIDRVRDATDLVELIGAHVALKSRGREHVGLCPFHDDHTPSLAVVTHKGNAFYKCHSCGAAGDVFNFVMGYHRMDFPSALRFLADRAGINLTPRTANSETDRTSKSMLIRANQHALNFFQQSLGDPEIGRHAREIFERRGVSDAMVSAFALGYAPAGGEKLLATLGSSQAAQQIACDAGLVKRRADGGLYDAFRNRLIFPIFDEVGRPVAFGGRQIDPDEQPKYLNSAESAAFSKSRTLYALHLAKRSIQEQNCALVTEGYTDVIACHQAGITNAVATLGTALTREHARLLSRWCDTVVLLFDGDEAGQRAAERALEVFFNERIDVRVCILPDGCDPDELLKQPGGDARFEQAIAQARDAVVHVTSQFVASYRQVESISGREKAFDEFATQLRRLGIDQASSERRRLVITTLADAMALPMSDIERALAPTRARSGATSRRSQDAEAPGEPQSVLPLQVRRKRRFAEHDLLAIVMFDPEVGRNIVEHFSAAHFVEPAAHEIATLVFPWLEGNKAFAMQDVLSGLEDASARSTASELYFRGEQMCEAAPDHPTDVLQAAIQSLQLCLREEELKEEIAQSKSGGDGRDQVAALLRLVEKRREHGDVATAIPQGIRS